MPDPVERIRRVHCARARDRLQDLFRDLPWEDGHDRRLFLKTPNASRLFATGSYVRVHQMGELDETLFGKPCSLAGAIVCARITPSKKRPSPAWLAVSRSFNPYMLAAYCGPRRLVEYVHSSDTGLLRQIALQTGDVVRCSDLQNLRLTRNLVPPGQTFFLAVMVDVYRRVIIPKSVFHVPGGSSALEHKWKTFGSLSGKESFISSDTGPCTLTVPETSEPFTVHANAKKDDPVSFSVQGGDIITIAQNKECCLESESWNASILYLA